MLEYRLMEPTAITVDVMDANGRVLSSLKTGELQGAGVYAVAWNGRDLRGRSLPSGVYMVRLRTPDSTETRRIMLAR